MFKSELQWLFCRIEADDPHSGREILYSMQKRQGIGRRAQADIPDYEFLSGHGNPFWQTKLLDVKRFGLRHWANDRMESFVVFGGTNTEFSIGQTDELVTVTHALLVWNSKITRQRLLKTEFRCILM